jgi:hypothetical protein
VNALARAQRALEDAKALDVSLVEEHPPVAYDRLLDLATVQALVAQAEALDRVAAALERISS